MSVTAVKVCALRQALLFAELASQGLARPQNEKMRDLVYILEGPGMYDPCGTYLTLTQAYEETNIIILLLLFTRSTL